MTHDRAHMTRMTHLAAPLVIALSLGLAMPGHAQQKDPSETEQGFSLVEEGMKLLFKGLMAEMEPALDEMAKAMQELEPMARELAAMIGDVRNYEPPVQLPNGDILIRRKPDAPQPPDFGPKLPDKTAPSEGQIEL